MAQSHKTTYKVKIDDKVKDLTVVDPSEVNPAQGLVSWESPIAQAIADKEPGQSTNVLLPNGREINVEILGVAA